MKRSEINTIMRESLDFMKRMNFFLPPFASWIPEEWKKKGPECSEIIEQQLGWDITDFGSGDFYSTGLFLFTIRNGTLEELKKMWELEGHDERYFPNLEVALVKLGSRYCSRKRCSVCPVKPDARSHGNTIKINHQKEAR